jgi:hypothetical protein
MPTTDRALLGLVLSVVSACSAPSTLEIPGLGAVAPPDGPRYARSCPPGTMPVSGRADCLAIGWRDCPANFEPDPTGWGCLDITPSAACTGATRGALGARTCRSVGDCNAPFPPAQATFFVDPAHAEDATHRRSLSAALLAAPDGATIAVERGTYTEATLELRKKVVLVGRCAAQVIVQSDGSDRAGLVILGDTGPDTVVRGLTLRNFLWGTDIAFGGQLRVRDAVFDRNRETGLTVRAGGKVTLENCLVRETQPNAANRLGLGAYVSDGATLDVRDSTFDANTGAGIWVVHQPGRNAGNLVMTGSVIANHKPNVDLHGQGLFTDPGTTVAVDHSVFSNNAAFAIDIDGTQNVTLSDLVIRGTAAGAAVQLAHGASVSLARALVSSSGGNGLVAFHEGTQLVMRDTVIRGTRYTAAGEGGWGLGVAQGAHVTASTTALVENGQGAQISGDRTNLILEQSLIATTSLNSLGDEGFGIVSQEGGWTSLLGVSVLNTFNAGILVTQAAARLDADQLLVLGTRSRTIAPLNGHGVFANDATLSLSQTLITQSAQVGLGFSSSSGLVSDCMVSDNAVGALFQLGTTARDVEQLGALEPSSVQLRSTSFVRNGMKVVSETVPVPTAPRRVTPR